MKPTRHPRSAGSSARAEVPAPRTAPGEVRLIGGQWKRSKLAVPDVPGLRPTPSRVRETLFNWLGQDLRGWCCVDAFAGSGALGFEAASRGALHVLLCEQHAQAVQALLKLRERLGASAVEVRRADGLAMLSQLPAASVDLVLLDPPFDSDLAERALPLAARAVREGAWVYLESSHDCRGVAWLPPDLEVQRYLKAATVHAHLLRKTTRPLSRPHAEAA